MTTATRRVIVALALVAPLFLLLALGLQLWAVQNWVVFVLASIGMCLIGLILIIADGIACECDAREADAEVEITYAGGGAWIG